MYHACTLRGPPAGLEKLTGHRLCPLCPGHTHTASSKRSSSASSVPSSLPRAESQRPSGFLEQVLPISGGVLWAAQFVPQSSEREETVVLEHHGRTMIHCCLPSQRPCFAPARALGAGRATVPRTSSQRPCRAPAARLGSVGTFSVVTYVNCLRPTAAELLPLLHIVHSPAHASTSAPPQS